MRHNQALIGAPAERREGGEQTFAKATCGMSRSTLATVRQSGEKPGDVEYLNGPVSGERLVELIVHNGIPVRALLSVKSTPYAELGLDDLKCLDDNCPTSR